MPQRTRIGLLGAVAGCVLTGSAALREGSAAEDFRSLRINEVIADNASEPPVDVAGSSTDMIEIYNPTDSPIDIGTSDPATSLALTDSLELPYDDPTTPITEPGPYTFSPGLRVRAKGWVVVFCDDNPIQNLCEPHASFRISSSGDEPITLWGPIVGYDAQNRPIREVIDQIWLPPLGEDVSFGRYPDGAGPAPVPLDQSLSAFSFHAPGNSTFGTCTNLANPCPAGNARTCLGKANAPGNNIPPRIELLSASSNRPEAGEAVELRVRVEDERSPLPAAGGGSIVRAQVRYRVDAGPTLFVDLAYDGQGIRHAPLLDADGNPIDPDPENPDSEFVAGENPFNVWTEWTGVLPGQPAGARVEFHLFCEDSGVDGDPDTAGDNLTDTSPGSLCDEVYPGETVGPCDREFGGPGCDRDSEDVVRCGTDDGGGDEGDGGGAETLVFPGVRYIACSKWFTYRSGYEVRAALRGLVINEVVASQTSLLMDPSEASRVCRQDNPTCQYDNLAELRNTSAQTIDLSGLWLSDSRFNPQGWQFPDGASIEPGEILIVWLDNDGWKCPCPSASAPDSVYCQRAEDQQPCFWECPDPTDVATKSYHTNFSIAADVDQLYLRDTEANGFGIIDGVEWEALGVDCSLSRVSDGAGGTCWIQTCKTGTDFAPTPESENVGECPDVEQPRFLRGDANTDCAVEISDGIFLLNYLFTGGAPPKCQDASDADDNGALEITDAIMVLNYLFLGGAAPPYPGPSEPGPDTTSDDLDLCVPPSC